MPHSHSRSVHHRKKFDFKSKKCAKVWPLLGWVHTTLYSFFAKQTVFKQCSSPKVSFNLLFLEINQSIYIFWYSKLLVPVVYLAVLVQTGLWVVCTAQHLPNSWFLPIPVRKVMSYCPNVYSVLLSIFRLFSLS